MRQIMVAATAQGIGSQLELAQRAGITPETLSRVRRRGTADFSTVVRLMDAAGLELAVRPKTGGRRQFVREALDFPYNWSNPAMSDETLIHKVLERSRLEDVVRIVQRFGYPRVKGVAETMGLDERPVLRRTLRNIERGIKVAADAT